MLMTMTMPTLTKTEHSEEIFKNQIIPPYLDVQIRTIGLQVMTLITLISKSFQITSASEVNCMICDGLAHNARKTDENTT